MKTTKKILSEIRKCCHHGHGASLFEDGTVIQAINSNDVIARSRIEGGWEYRIAYIDDPKYTLSDLQDLIERQIISRSLQRSQQRKYS